MLEYIKDKFWLDFREHNKSEIFERVFEVTMVYLYSMQRNVGWMVEFIFL